ncbi:hypothetical protein [Abyssisolibacter fermentans]|uniref:hypothetical protein n=1 Tax=Abyssisolibacter fermentans TaxID=1766203 RepID=UPI0008295465|nr:hypothetical protein [Abyssisolibacter fermentans]
MSKKTLFLIGIIFIVVTIAIVNVKIQNIGDKTVKDVENDIDEQAFSLDNISSYNSFIKKSVTGKYIYKKFYSPDYKNCFIAKIGYTEDDDDANTLYLNNITDTYFELIDNIKDPVIWLSNEKVLVNGVYIYNIETKTIEKHIMKEILDDNHLINYSLDHKKEKIALCLTDKLNNTKECSYLIYVYDIKNDSYKKIYEKKNASIDLTLANYYIVWDKNSNIIFDSNDFKIMKFDTKLNTLKDYIKVDIDKDIEYIDNQQTEETDEYGEPPITDKMMGISKDNKYISIRSGEELVRIIDTENNVEVESSSENRIPYSPDFCWINTNVFAYIVNFVQSTNEIHICSINDGVYSVKSVIECEKLKKDNNFIYNLRLDKDKLIFDVVEFSSPSFETIEKVTTYEIISDKDK